MIAWETRMVGWRGFHRHIGISHHRMKANCGALLGFDAGIWEVYQLNFLLFLGRVEFGGQFSGGEIADECSSNGVFSSGR